MDREKLFEDIPIFLLLAILFLLRIAPPEIRDYLFWGGFIVTIAFIMGTEYAFRIKASQYLYIRLIVRPLNAILHLFIMEPPDGIHSRVIDSERNIYETPLTLGEPLKSRHFKGVRQVVIKHQLLWEKRFIALPGKAVFRGYQVDHAKTATMVVWTPKEGQTMIEHLEPIPIFVLAEAPRDYYLTVDPVTVEPDPQPSTEIQTPTAQNHTNVEALRRQVIEWKRYGFDQHQKLIQIEGEFQQIKNEFRGALSRTRDVSKLVLEELMTLLSAHTEIEDAVNEVRKRPWIVITTATVVLILGVFGMYEFSTNEDVRSWISQNTILLIVLAVCAVFIFSFLYGRRRHR
jgi:hypothetical protein